MSVVISVAPPDGWQRWPTRRISKWFTTAPRAKRSVGLSYEVDSLKVNLPFFLENRSIGSVYPTVAQLHLASGVLSSLDVEDFLVEVGLVRLALRTVPVENVLSLENYFARISGRSARAASSRRKMREWQSVVDGRTHLDHLSPAELDFERRRFATAYPSRRLRSAADLYGHILTAYADVGRQAKRRGRGLVLA